jgi:hypothetical protein
MASLDNYNRANRLFKRRTDPGKIPLHTDIAVNLGQQNSSANPHKILKLESITFCGKTINGHFTVIVVGHYQGGVHIEKHYSDDMTATGGDLPAYVNVPVESQPVHWSQI